MAFVSPVATGTGWIRLGHLSPGTPPVDVCVYSSGNSSARIGLPEVEYGDISPYVSLSAGDYSIAIRAAGASASGRAVISQMVVRYRGTWDLRAACMLAGRADHCLGGGRRRAGATGSGREVSACVRTVVYRRRPLRTALLHVNTGVFHWAIIATAVWALLNVVISLDPAIRDKIDTARSLAQTISEARRGNG